jgi:ABC-type multidrug transport system fused ATPase/permease subunit
MTGNHPEKYIWRDYNMVRETKLKHRPYSMVGRISFIVGLVLVAIIALFSATLVPAWAIFVIGALGILVGLLNIAEGEVNTFLIAAIAFLLSFQALSSIFSDLTFGWTAVPTFFGLLTIFIAPAAAIVAVKAVFSVTRD